MQSSRNSEPLLVISPHLDDAVLSCGRLLASHPGSIVLTIFAGEPQQREELSEWDAQSGFDAGDDVMAARRDEDRRALSRLRARWHWLDGIDHQYREGWAVDQKGLAKAVAQQVEALHPSIVLLPLGLHHPDHVLSSEISLAAMEETGQSRWLLYGDVYDRSKPHLVQPRLTELEQRFEITPVELPGDGRIRKLYALAAYKSQLGPLGGWRHIARTRWSAGEQLWSCMARSDQGVTIPRISVVIPAFNRETAVERAVASAMSQRCPVPHEVIVVDDGSSDRSAEVAERAGATVIRLDQNQGVSKARNQGICAARGEWVAFLDSDDLWAPDHLATLWGASVGVGLVASSGVRVFPHSLRRRGLPSRRSVELRSPDDALRPENVIGTSACMVRTDVLRRVGGFESGLWPEDLDVWLRVLRETPGRLLPDLTVAWYSDTDSLSNQSENSYQRVFDTLERHRAAGHLHRRVRRRMEVAAGWDRFRSGDAPASSLARPAVVVHLPGLLWSRFWQRRWRNQYAQAKLLEEMTRTGHVG